MAYKKIDFIVYLRSIAIILVVLGHVLCSYSRIWRAHVDPIDNFFWQNVVEIIYAIHMPIFSLISGYIYIYIRKSGGYSSILNFLIKKTERIFLPLVIWSVIESIIDFNCNLFFAPLHLWYLWFIFKCFILTRFIDFFIIKRTWLVLILILICFIKTYLFPNVLADDPHFFKLYPYFLIGIAINILSDKYVIKREYIYLITCAAILFFGASYILHSGYGYVAYALNISVFLSFLVTQFVKTPSILNNLDKCSMGIYLIHHPIIWNAVENDWIWEQMINHQYTTPIILFMAVFALSWSLTYIFLRTKFLKYIFG